MSKNAIIYNQEMTHSIVYIGHKVTKIKSHNQQSPQKKYQAKPKSLHNRYPQATCKQENNTHSQCVFQVFYHLNMDSMGNMDI